MFLRYSLDVPSMFLRCSFDVPSTQLRAFAFSDSATAVVYLSSLVAIRADVYLLAMAENLAAEVLSFGTMPDVA